MKSHQSSIKNRRQFLKSAVRMSVLGGLIFFGFDIGRRKQSAAQVEQQCRVGGLCNCCSQLTLCRVPKAMLYKENNIRAANIK
jgi:hypothetical protein